MKKYYLIALSALMVMSTFVASAANGYKCNFEDETQRKSWVLNPTANASIASKLHNKWYMGALGNNDMNGHYGLYLSADSISNNYVNSSNFLVAYDTLTLNELQSAGSYVLTFDWKGMGNMASDNDGLYVLWIPVDKVPAGPMCTTNDGMPNSYLNYVISLQPLIGYDYLRGTSTWKQASVEIPSEMVDGTPHYLVFAWDNGVGMAQQPAAAIDNIEISDSRSCSAPKNLKLEIKGSSSILSWTAVDSMATTYEVMAYSYATDKWFGPYEVDTTICIINGIKDGQADFVVRTKCADDLYSLKTIVSKLVYYPDNMCVDYLNLDNASCYINAGSPTSTLTFNNFTKVPAVDNGPADINSRHTVHFDKNEVEQRTGGKLHTVPEGELASVRLGNWDSNNQAERIEFSFEVDTLKYSVLLLKYATILEAPGHEDEENPRFKLDLLVGGHSIGECGQADFNCNDVYAGGALLPGAAEMGWHITSRTDAATSADVVWKDWTTVGVNLRNPAYQGKKLTARLTTHDCTFSAHCGYAYFTLGCSDGKLKDMACAAINPVFNAPDGFNYRWILKSDEIAYRQNFDPKYVKGRSQTFEAGYQDTCVYAVDCMFVQDSTCYFTLYASAMATYPKPVIKQPVITKNCREGKYYVHFDASESYVEEVNHLLPDSLKYQKSEIYTLENFNWSVPGTSVMAAQGKEVDLVFPSTGGHFDVNFNTYYGSCDTVVVIPLDLEPLDATRDTTVVYLCDADIKAGGYHWSEKQDTVYRTYGVDSIVYVSEVSSCDSILYLQLLPPHREFVEAIVFDEDLPYHFHGKEYSKPVCDTISNATCDTTWTINLSIYEKLHAALAGEWDDPTQPFACENAENFTLTYSISHGYSNVYSLIFNDSVSFKNVHRAPTPVHANGNGDLIVDIAGTVRANYYSGLLILHDTLSSMEKYKQLGINTDVKLPFTFTLRYNSNVIGQRWNDVLFAKNAESNEHGYAFIPPYQWYVDGDSIAGAIGSVLHQNLSFSNGYSADLSRVVDGDTITICTCSYTPTKVPSDYQDTPKLVQSLVPASAPMRLTGQGMAQWIDVTGRVWSTQAFTDSDIISPARQGVYLLTIYDSKENTKDIYYVIVGQ